MRTAEEEAKAVTEELDEPEREALRRAFGEGSSGKGVAKAMRGMAGAMKDLEDRQKSRATRVKRDTLDQALLELALFYRDILMLQLGADAELANDPAALRKLASSATPEATLRRLSGHHALPRAPHPQRRPPARRGRNGPLPLRRLTPRRARPPHPHPHPSASVTARRVEFNECGALPNLSGRAPHLIESTLDRDGADGERGAGEAAV